MGNEWIVGFCLRMMENSDGRRELCATEDARFTFQTARNEMKSNRSQTRLVCHSSSKISALYAIIVQSCSWLRVKPCWSERKNPKKNTLHESGYKLWCWVAAIAAAALRSHKIRLTQFTKLSRFFFSIVRLARCVCSCAVFWCTSRVSANQKSPSHRVPLLLIMTNNFMAVANRFWLI